MDCTQLGWPRPIRVRDRCVCKRVCADYAKSNIKYQTWNKGQRHANSARDGGARRSDWATHMVWHA